jgi:hypothetical protein
MTQRGRLHDVIITPSNRTCSRQSRGGTRENHGCVCAAVLSWKDLEAGVPRSGQGQRPARVYVFHCDFPTPAPVHLPTARVAANDEHSAD